MPELKPIFSHRQWQFRNLSYPSAPWHFIISQYELDLLAKYPDRFAIRYIGKDSTIWQKSKESSLDLKPNMPISYDDTENLKMNRIK